MSNVLIIGATSAIAEATARLFAARGDVIYLIGRDKVRLSQIADDLRVRGASRVGTDVLDVCAFEAHALVIERARRDLATFDIVLVAHGSLPDQALCQHDIGVLRREFETNAVATVALLTCLANALMAQKHGQLAVIGSVAGDRGRAENYVYGSAKAAVEVFMSGLRQHLHGTGVNVLTIKPGFVDTPMTRAFDKGILWAKPQEVARGIVSAIDRRRHVVYLPGFWRVLMFVVRHVPEFVFKRLRF